MDEAAVMRIENRIRGLVMDLIEPTIRRSTEASDSINKLVHGFEMILFRVDDIEEVQTKTLSKLSYLDDFSKRIMELSSNQSVLETIMHRDKQEIQSQVRELTEKTITNKEEINVLDHQRIEMKSTISDLSHSVMNAKYELEQKIAAFKDEYRDKLIDMESRVTRTEVGSDNTYKKISKIGKEMAEICGTSKIIEKKFEEHVQNMKSIEGKILEIKNDGVSKFESARMAGIKLNAEIARVEKICKGIIGKLQKFEENEVKNRLNSTEPLYMIFSDVVALKILANYDMERVNLVNETSKEINEIVEKLKEKTQKILEIPDPVKNDFPLSIPSKRKKRRGNTKNTRKVTEDFENNREEKISLRKKSIAIEQILPQRTVEVFEISSITPVLTISKEKTEKIEKEEKKIEKDEKKIEKVEKREEKRAESPIYLSSDSESGTEPPYEPQFDYSPIIEAVKVELQKEITEKINILTEINSNHIENLKIALEKYKNELSYGMNLIKEENAQQFKEYSKTLHDVELITQQVVYECTSQLTTRKRENNDFSSELKNLQVKILSLTRQNSTIVESIEALSLKLRNLAEYCYLGSVLQQQDDVDRESIALMGYKDAKAGKLQQRSNKPIISIEKQCLSCAGQSSVVLNAFKIACLAYAPSSIIFEGETYQRKEIIEMQIKYLATITNRESKTANVDRKQAKTASTTMKNWRPVSVPSPQVSPHSDFPDAELPRILRKSINL